MQWTDKKTMVLYFLQISDDNQFKFGDMHLTLFPGRKYITTLYNVQQTNGHIGVGFQASSKIRCISECVYDSACVAVNVRQTHPLHCQLLNTIDTTQHTVHTQWNVLEPAC